MSIDGFVQHRVERVGVKRVLELKRPAESDGSGGEDETMLPTMIRMRGLIFTKVTA